MKAARLRDVGKPLVVEDVPEPQVTTNSVKVKIARCGVCRTDVHFVLEGLMKPAFDGQIMGHEAAGEVVEVGTGVTDVRVGERVIISTTQGCDQCSFCRSGRENLCNYPRTFGFQTNGGYAEYAVTPSNYVAKMPDRLDWNACVLADAGAAAYHAVNSVGGVNAGDKVLIVGAGGLGLFAAQICKLIGASVLVTDINEMKLKIALDLGADSAISILNEDFVQHVREFSGSDGGPDAILEFASTKDTIPKDFGLLKKGGRVVFVGYHPEGIINKNPIELIMKEASLLFSKGATLKDLISVVNLANEQEIKLSIDRVMPLTQVNEALLLVKENKALGRICIDVSR